MFLYEYMSLVILDKYLVIGMLGYMTTLWIPFWETAKLFCQVDAPFCNYSISVGEFQFLYILSNTYYCLSFFIIAILLCMWSSISSWFLFKFPRFWECRESFHVLISYCLFSLEKMSLKNFTHSLFYF